MLRYLTLTLLVVTILACTRQEVRYIPLHAPFLQSGSMWADSIVLTMTDDEKISQLLIFRPELSEDYQKENLIDLAANNQLGGVVLENLTLTDYIQLIDSLQQLSKIPLLNASFNQVSLHNQFSDVTDLPLAATISAIDNDSIRDLILTYHMDQLENLGFNLSFAPTVNINTAASSTFDFHTIENDEDAILTLSSKVLNNIQDRKILSTAGSFNDLHYIENDTLGLVDSMLFRYRNLAVNGVSGIYADPRIFELDSLMVLPPHFLKRFLFEHAEFNGLLIADWDNNSFQEVAYSGIDLFIVKDSFENRFNIIRELVNNGDFTQEDLNARVSKVLQAKSWMGLDAITPKIDQELAQSIISAGFDDFEIRKMYETGMILAQNPKYLIPFKDTYKENFQVIHIGHEELWDFQKSFSKYAAFSDSKIQPDSSGTIAPLKISKFKHSKTIISLDGIEVLKNRDSAFIASVNKLGQSNKVVLLNFGNPLNLIHFDTTIVIIQNFERNPITESLSAQLLFGALQAKGKLPLTLNENLRYQHGIDNTPITRLKYTIPEEVGIAAYQLVGIDAIAKSAIFQKAIPGCQVLVAKEGKIIYSKSFGRHDFERGKLVQNSDLYDIASITKIASTTLGAMKLYDDKKIKINNKLKNYIDLGEGSKLRNIKIKELLTHQSGLQPNMPIAPFILYEDSTGTGCSGYFCKTKSQNYLTAIADSFYMDSYWQDSIWQQVYDLKPYKRKRYRYSDVNFNLLMKVVENKTHSPLDDYIYETFYNPMNLDRLTYKPLDRFSKREIVPTTKEERFRNQLIHGYVHDESAALLGGVAGNAGLFSNTESMAPLFQMLLNKGTYGGQKFLSEETINLFTKQQRGSKRGLGFDVKTRAGTNGCSDNASSKTFGHTGFTGTCVWVDPESDLVFIFLSNRIHPDINNRKLFRKKIRTRMHSLVYDALDSYPNTEKQSKKETPVLVRAAATNTSASTVAN